MSAPAIALRGITKRYGQAAAIEGVTLEIEAGSICGLLGRNGAGKTTTFRCLLGFVRLDGGSVTIDGAPVGPSTFASLGFVPEVATLYESLSVEEHLRVYRRTYRSWDDPFARALLDRFEVDRRKRPKALSKGMRTAVLVTLAFGIRPRFLVLDEPTSGLDPIHQREVLDLAIDAAANGATVLFSTHQVAQVERVADRVAIIERGRIVLDRNVDDLRSDEKIVEAVFAGEIPDLDGLAGDGRIVRLERSGSTLRAITRVDSDEIAQRIFALRPRSIRTIDLNLEDIFMHTVGKERP